MCAFGVVLNMKTFSYISSLDFYGISEPLQKITGKRCVYVCMCVLLSCVELSMYVITPVTLMILVNLYCVYDAMTIYTMTK